MKLKHVAIFLMVLVVAAMVGVGWLYMTAQVSVVATGVTAFEAASQAALFGELQQQAANDAIVGTVYSTEPIGDIGGYQFYTYTIRLRNDCFIDAESVEVQVTPMAGDVVQLGDFSPKTLPARTTGDIQATILTDVAMHGVREVNITYYLWGFPFTLRTTCGK